jgi:hypothetical protein
MVVAKPMTSLLLAEGQRQQQQHEREEEQVEREVKTETMFTHTSLHCCPGSVRGEGTICKNSRDENIFCYKNKSLIST